MNESLSNLVNRLLPLEVGEELKRNIDATIQSYLERMNLATREQMGIQEKILQRSRERIQQLEQRVEALERGRSDSAEGS